MSKGKDSPDSRALWLAAVFLVSILVFQNWVALVALYLRLRPFIAIGLGLFSSLLFTAWFTKGSVEKKKKFEKQALIKPVADEDAVFAGVSEAGERVSIKHRFRRMHTQVIGTTNAGKTESIIIPWAADDMKKGRGLLIIDGKSDRSLLDKLYAYAEEYGRTEDVRILSLCSPEISNTFNPLAGGTPFEITERVFKALNFENEYFKSIQFSAFLKALEILKENSLVFSPLRVIELLTSTSHMNELAKNSGKSSLINWASDFTKLSREEREQRTSGLISQLQAFTAEELSPIFNQKSSDIDLDLALHNGLIIYCQLPVLKIPTLGKATGKLVLQALQGAIASRHLNGGSVKPFYSVYLDDFTEYLTEGFVSTLNKSRSANVLITFAHQAIGDLAVLGEDIKNTILTNANLKVFMRTNEPTSAEYFSKVIGTLDAEKVTERQTKDALGTSRTGEGSVRDVEQFRFHPNVFKQELGTGEAVVVIPHGKGSHPIRLQFNILPDLKVPKIPYVKKDEPQGLPSVENTKADEESKPPVTAGLIEEGRKEAA